MASDSEHDSGVEYLTEDDRYTKIVPSYTASGSEPADSPFSFTAFLKDGRRMVYGVTDWIHGNAILFVVPSTEFRIATEGCRLDLRCIAASDLVSVRKRRHIDVQDRQ